MSNFITLPAIDFQVRVIDVNGDGDRRTALIPGLSGSLQHDALAVCDDVAQGVVEQEDIWISCVSMPWQRHRLKMGHFK